MIFMPALCGQSWRKLNLADISLTLFFSAKTNLSIWDSVGNLNRELRLYKHLSKRLKRVNFITYGPLPNKTILDSLEGIEVLSTAWHFGTGRTVSSLLSKHSKALKESDVLKTNQIIGSQIAAKVKKVYGNKLIVRCGYSHARFSELAGSDWFRRYTSRHLERKSFLASDIGIVTTENDRNWICENLQLRESKFRVVPNYVDIDLFKPPTDKIEAKYELVYVGRSGYQKNLLSFLEAVKILNKSHRLLLIGSCADDNQLKIFADKHNLNVSFKANIAHEEIPKWLSASRCFVLPSLYEGHPKVLLEAMSCELPCIGTNVQGIREVIKDGKTGILCDTTPKGMAQAMDSVLTDEPLRNELGKNARRYILENLSFDNILQKEIDVLEEVIQL